VPDLKLKLNNMKTKEDFIKAELNVDRLTPIQWSDKQMQFVARAEPIKGQTQSWRDISWIKNLSNKYIEMVGTILFDEEMRKRFDGVYR
jgi:hypothetical protein